jgi:hypothetical protein
MTVERKKQAERVLFLLNAQAVPRIVTHLDDSQAHAETLVRLPDKTLLSFLDWKMQLRVAIEAL